MISMNKLKVKKVEELPNAVFEVEVIGETKTKHKVSLSEDYYKKLTNGNVPAEELVKRSFDFLLAREKNTSILSEFNLSLIQTYFPDFESEITRNITK